MVRGMAELGAAERARLPDSAFAYIDSRGRRRLPIHDAGHVRNALARFNQVAFEDDAARDRARKRLLNAAKKFRIVPVGFITNQLQSERDLARRDDGPIRLPSGFVTMLLTDIEGSTALVQRLGDRYGELLERVRALLRDTAVGSDGHVVETRADEFFAAFEQPAAALSTALTVQRELRGWPLAGDEDVRIRVGIHSGYPRLAKANYIGMAVHTAARICTASHGGQIVVSGDFRTAVGVPLPTGVRLRKLGTYALRGLPDEVELYQVVAKGLASRFPPLRISL
jgi:class 3 adenylate cyclase